MRAVGLLTIALLVAGPASSAPPPVPTDPVQLVKAFDEMVMQHRAREAILRFVSPDLIEHDPTVPGGSRQGLFDYMVKEGWDEGKNPFPQMVDIVDRRFGSGEYVVTEHHILRDKQDRGTVFVDTFRVVDGKIVEHWDVAQPVPEKNAGNPHPMW